MARLDELATFSDEPDAADPPLPVAGASPRDGSRSRPGWQTAGMAARIDAVGNVVGRYEASRPGAPAVLIGSHIDTVIDAGKYDGALGVLAGIAAVEALHRARRAPAGRARGDRVRRRGGGALSDRADRLARASPARSIRALLDARDGEGVSRARGARRGRLRSLTPTRAAPAGRRTRSAISRSTSSRGRCSRPRACRSAS